VPDAGELDQKSEEHVVVLFLRGHGELGDDRSKPWLKPGSLSMKKLNEAIRGKKDCWLKDLAMMTEFQHTSINKNINAKHNTYFSKQYAYDPLQAGVRACLTVIDHNQRGSEAMQGSRQGRQGRDYDHAGWPGLKGKDHHGGQERHLKAGDHDQGTAGRKNVTFKFKSVLGIWI
jgi:hypothetical protein